MMSKMVTTGKTATWNILNPSTRELLNDSKWHDAGAVFKGNLNVANCLQFDLN
jgi:hypothetical protein